MRIPESAVSQFERPSPSDQGSILSKTLVSLTPIRHVRRLTPRPGRILRLRPVSAAKHDIAELGDVGRDSMLVATLCFIRYSLGHDPAPTSMFLAAFDGECIGRTVN